MKKIFLICLLILLVFNLTAQKQNVDSLLNILNTQKLSSEKQLELYEKICKLYYLKDLDKTILYAERGLVIAKKENNKQVSAVLNELIGDAYDRKSSYDTALIYFNRALDIAIDINNKERELSVIMNIASSYQVQNKYDISLEYYMKALPLSESLNNKKQHISALSNIGGIYRTLKNSNLAASYLERALTIAEEQNDIGGMMKTCFELGAFFFEIGDYDKALEHELKALAHSRKIGKKEFEMVCLEVLANIYLKKNDNNTALMYANECLQIAEELGGTKELIRPLLVLSGIYREQQHYKESEAAAYRAWEIDSTSILGSRVSIAANIAVSNIYLGNKEKAVDFFKKYDEFVADYINENYQKVLMDMEAKYNTEKKEMRIITLEKEKQLYMLYIWLGIACVAILLLVIGLMLFRHRLNLQKRKLAEQQIKQLEQENQLIATQAVLDGETAERSRLARDLHDGLGGMLSVVKLNLKDMKSFSIIDGADLNRFNKALEMLDESISELRRVAHHMMPESLMRYGLKVSLEDFCRAIPGADFRYLGDDERLDNQLEVLLYRCTYELVNNAVKYANATSINIQLIIDNGLVSLTVHDNGIGFDPQKLTSGSGLDNIRTRVSVYNGKMNIYSSPNNGTEVNIEIELL